MATRARPKRTRIAEGVYEDRYGISVRAKVRGAGELEERFPHGTPLRELTKRRDELRVQLRDQAARPARGTLAADAERYYAEIRHLASWRERRAEIRAWLKARVFGAATLGGMSRSRIGPSHVRRARVAWLAAGVAPKTINNRVNALRHLYRTLDGKKHATPCDEVDPLPIEKTPIVVVEASTVRAVERTLSTWEASRRLRDAKTRARFRVVAACGRRPSEIMRARPEDVDLQRRIWIPRDGKGGFSPGMWLNDDMLAAWRLFVDAKAWGKFREGSWVRTLREAGWPAGVRVYNLRHTVGITLSEQGADLADVAPFLGHRRLETTRRHYVPVLHSRQQQLSEMLAGRFGWGGDPAVAPADLVARATAALKAAGFVDEELARVLRVLPTALPAADGTARPDAAEHGAFLKVGRASQRRRKPPEVA